MPQFIDDLFGRAIDEGGVLGDVLLDGPVREAEQSRGQPDNAGQFGSGGGGASGRMDSPGKALGALNSPNLSWRDVEPAELSARVDALATVPAARLKREWGEYEDVLIKHQAEHSQAARWAEEEPNNQTWTALRDEHAAKIGDIEARMDAIEGAMRKGHGLAQDEGGRWKTSAADLEPAGEE